MGARCLSGGMPKQSIGWIMAPGSFRFNADYEINKTKAPSLRLPEENIQRCLWKTNIHLHNTNTKLQLVGLVVWFDLP